MIHTCKCSGRVVPIWEMGSTVARFRCDGCGKRYYQRKRLPAGHLFAQMREHKKLMNREAQDAI